MNEWVHSLILMLGATLTLIILGLPTLYKDWKERRKDRREKKIVRRKA